MFNRFVTKTLAIAVAISGLMGLGAKEASANITTEVIIYNNSPTATLTLAKVNNWNSQEWLTTNPDGGGGPFCSTGGANGNAAGAPTTIGPGQSACLYSHATCPTCGTAAILIYNINDWAAVNLPSTSSVYATFQWDTPYTSEPPLNIEPWSFDESLTYTYIKNVQTMVQTGYAELDYTVGGNDDGGYGAQFYFNGGGAPNGGIVGGSTGLVGTGIHVVGSGFDNSGRTQIFFNGHASTSVTCTDSQNCTAVAPEAGSIPSGSVPVTTSVNGGALGQLGNFTFINEGPNCNFSYSAPSTLPNSAAQFIAACSPNAYGDPIWIYQKQTSGWQIVYTQYPVSSGNSAFVPFASTTTGTTGTFIACSENSGRGLAYPGQNGCFPSSTTVSIPSCAPETEQTACSAAAICGGTVPNGCGGTVSCAPSDCSTGNCTGNHCCPTGTTWAFNTCYAPTVSCPSGWVYCGDTDGCMKGKCQ